MDEFKAVIEKFGCKFVAVAHGLVWFTEPVMQSTLVTPEIGFSEERVVVQFEFYNWQLPLTPVQRLA